MSGVLRPRRNCWTLADVTESGLLVDGHDYYRAFWYAARRAQRYILIAGWQFDSEARLLRGAEAEHVDFPITVLEFLDDLCHRNTRLRVRILAWDFSLLYAWERETMQRWLFHHSTSPRLQFYFDDHHPVGASHHQKFAIIDGHVAFLGGMDLCADRWDERDHRAEHPERRDPRAHRYGPYHDMSAFVTGVATAELVELFRQRWRDGTGEELELPEVDHPAGRDFEPTLSFPFRRVGLSRTRGRLLSPPRDTVEEIRHLYEDAIAEAEELVYIENQYFTSHVVYEALADRMRAADRGKLQIIILLPRRPEAVKEEIALGMRQAHLLRTLRDIAEGTGHDFGVFYSASRDGEGKDVPTYIHSKVLLVDDRLLSVGSANTTNRSLGLDTELNISWEAHTDVEQQVLRRARVDLLGEHCGSADSRVQLERTDRLVRRLEQLAAAETGRLRLHPMTSYYDESELLQWLLPDDLMFDPDRAELEENVWEAMSSASQGPFASGVAWLRRWLEEAGR